MSDCCSFSFFKLDLIIKLARNVLSANEITPKFRDVRTSFLLLNFNAVDFVFVRNVIILSVLCFESFLLLSVSENVIFKSFSVLINSDFMFSIMSFNFDVSSIQITAYACLGMTFSLTPPFISQTENLQSCDNS